MAGVGQAPAGGSLAARLARAETVPSRTIPQVLAGAAARDPDGPLLAGGRGFPGTGPAGQFGQPGGLVPDHPQDGFFSS
jgi:hypothetical protein